MAKRQPKKFRKFTLLPDELKSMIIYLAIVARYPVVDPQAPVIQRNACAESHAHGKLPTLQDPRPSARAATRSTTAPRHYDAAELSLGAIRVVKSMFGVCWHTSMTTTPQVLRANKQCYELGMQHLYGGSNFLFTNPSALECFVKHYPAAAGRVQNVMLLLWDGLDFYVTDRQWVNPAFTNPQSINIHFLDWEQMEYIEVEEGQYQIAGGAADAAVTTQHRTSDLWEVTLLTESPVQIADGAELMDQVAILTEECGWTARKASVGEMEALEDQRIVEEMRAMLLHIRETGMD